MLKTSNFSFFGSGMTHGDAIISVTLADMIKHSALALIGRAGSSRPAERPQAVPEDAGALDETGRPARTEEPSWFEPSSHRAARLPSDSPLRADIGLLPLDNF